MTLQILEVFRHVLQVKLVAEMLVHFVGFKHLKRLVLGLHALLQQEFIYNFLVTLTLDVEVWQILASVNPVADGPLDFENDRD